MSKGGRGPKKGYDQVKIVAEDLEKFTTRVMVRLTTSIWAELQEATPVDTGWARANWHPSVRSPVTEAVADLSDGTEPTPELVQAAAAQSQAGLDEVAAYRFPHDGRVYIVNNAHYIQRLNEGHSPQAPPEFVQKAIQAGIAQAMGKKP